MHSSGQPWQPTARAVAVVYGAASVVWIMLLDWVVLAIAPDWPGLLLWQSLKPWLYIALTTGLLYYLLRRYELTHPPATGGIGVDVTDYRQALSDRDQIEQALRASEAKVRSLMQDAEAALEAERNLLTSIMNTSVAAIMVLNPQGQITYANKSAERVVGLKHNDISARTYSAPDWKHTDVDGGPWPDEKQPFVQVMTTGQPVFDVQHAIETQTGDRKYLSINGAPIKDHQGTITSLVFSFNDITDRFLSKRALEQREQYFKALTEHSSDIVVLLDGQGCFSYVTPSSERVLGYSPDVVVGHHATEFVHPDDGATILTVLDNAIQQPRQSQPLVEYRVRHANNTYRTFEAVTTSLLDDPIVRGVVVNCRDVTDRKQAEEALQDSEERYRSVVSLLTEGVVLHAIDGTIVAHNASAESILGMSMAEITRHRQIEDPIWYLTREDGSILNANQLPAAITLQTGEPQTGVTLGFRRPDGQFRWLMINSQPLRSPDETHLRGAVVSFSDITERRQQQQALQQSEEKFRSLTHCAPIGIYMVDADGYGTWVNPRLQAIAGFTVEESRDLGWSHFIHPEDLQRLQAHWKNCYAHGLPYDGEYRFLHRDGTIRWVHETTTAMYDDQGNLIGHVGAIEDITERKKAEEALEQSEARLRLALEASNITCWEYDLHGDQIDGMGRMSHGRWVAEPWTRSLDQVYGLIHADDCDRLRQEVTSAIASNGELISEYRLCLPGQSPRWVLLRGRVVMESGGDRSTTRLVGVSIDIDNLKQAEASIQQLNAALAQQNRDLEAQVEQRTLELTTFFNALPDRVFVIERSEMRIVFSNDLHAQSNFGIPNGKEIYGKTIFECFPPDRAAYFAEQNRQVFESGEVMRIQHDYQVGDRTVYMDTYKIPLKRPNGEVYALIGSGRDISELVEVRQALIARTVELEAANHELNSFSYSVSHDLRAPLRHLSGFVTALREELVRQGVIQVGDRPATAPLLNATGTASSGAGSSGAAIILRYLNIIDESNAKMAMLIDGLLTLSRVGRRQLERRAVSLQPLVEHAIEIVTSDPAVIRRTEFIVEALPTVRGDAALLQQVFANLIENAVKFSRDRHPACIQIGSLPDGTVFVKDNGVGFNMDYADQLFGAFQRLHSKQEFAGTGIGLAIVQRIIHRHGGKIWAESVLNQGATFYIKFGSSIVP